MSLSEETLSTKSSLQMPFTSCGSSIKSLDQIRQDLADQTAEYFKKGGKINTGSQPINDTTNIEIDMAKKRKRSHTSVASKMFVNSPIAFHDGKNRANDVAASGHQNIYSKMRKVGIRHTVIIGKTAYGTFSDVKDAIAKRDATREILGMEKAFY